MKREEIPATERDPDSDYIIDAIENKDISIFYGLYIKFKTYLFHYGNVRLRYKLLASTWLFATFIGLGYVFSGQEVDLPWSNWTTAALLCTLSSIGIYLLCYLDIIIYHRLTTAIFAGILDIESKYPELYRSAHETIELVNLGKRKKKGAIIFDGFYYGCFILVLLLTANISIYLEFYPISPKIAIISFAIGLIIIGAIEIILYINIRESSTIRLFKEHPSFKKYLAEHYLK